MTRAEAMTGVLMAATTWLKSDPAATRAVLVDAAIASAARDSAGSSRGTMPAAAAAALALGQTATEAAAAAISASAIAKAAPPAAPPAASAAASPPTRSRTRDARSAAGTRGLARKVCLRACEDEAAVSATVEEAGSSTRGGGRAASGWASPPWERLAAQGRQVLPRGDEAARCCPGVQQPNAGATKGGEGDEGGQGGAG